MKQQSFTCSIHVHAAPAEACHAITRVNEWWAKHVEGDTQHEGSTFVVRFGVTWGKFTITELVPGRKMVWHVDDCYLPIFNNITEWNGTRIQWDIAEASNGSQITFTHIGLVPGLECYNDCKGGWSFYVMESLYKLITKGKGLPGTGIRATIASGERVYKGTLYFKEDALPEVNGEYILIDVNQLQGEHVVSANAAQRLNKASFNAGQITGLHYMIVEDKLHFEGIDALQDILSAIVK